MKYLQIDSIDEINAILTCLETNDSKASGRVEVYTCSQQRSERRLLKKLEQQYKEDQAAVQYAIQQQQQRRRGSTTAASNAIVIPNTTTNGEESDFVPSSVSPPTQGLSPLGRMEDIKSRKTLFYLISTLNMTFPDYDFSSIKPQHFARHPLDAVVQEVYSIFASLGGELMADGLSRKLWNALDDIIGPNAPSMIETTHSHRLDHEEAKSNRKRPLKDTNELQMELDKPQHKHPHHQRTIAPPPVTQRRPSAGVVATTDIPEGWDDVVEIYSYEPDDTTGAGDPLEDDDEEDGASTIWSFYYLFFNRRHKRIVFFGMRNAG